VGWPGTCNVARAVQYLQLVLQFIICTLYINVQKWKKFNHVILTTKVALDYDAAKLVYSLELFMNDLLVFFLKLTLIEFLVVKGAAMSVWEPVHIAKYVETSTLES